MSIAAPGSTASTNISVVGGTVVSDVAGTVTLYPGYDSYIQVYVEADLNTSVTLKLAYVYRLSGVRVVYPVLLTIKLFDPPPRVEVRGYRVFPVLALQPLPLSLTGGGPSGGKG